MSVIQKLLLMIVLALSVAGCGEEFAAGLGTGVVTIKAMSDDAQERFLATVNEVNAETARLNAEIGAVKEIDINAFVKPETIAAFESLKGNKDPMTWVALASVLGAAFFGGKVHEKKKG